MCFSTCICVLSHPELIQATPNQCLSVSIFQDFIFAICKTIISTRGRRAHLLLLIKTHRHWDLGLIFLPTCGCFLIKSKQYLCCVFRTQLSIKKKNSLLFLSLHLPGFSCDESQLCQGHLSLWWCLCGFIGTGSPSTLSWPCLLTAISFSKAKQVGKNKRKTLK